MEDRGADANFSQLEREITGVAVLGRLDALRVQLAEGRWKEAIRNFRGMREQLRRVDPGLPERIVRLL